MLIQAEGGQEFRALERGEKLNKIWLTITSLILIEQSGQAVQLCICKTTNKKLETV